VKTIIIIFATLFFSLPNSALNAQITFHRIFGGANEDYAYSIHQTVDGGYIIAGYTTSFGAGSRDVYLIRTDVKGNALWTKTFGEGDTDYAYTVQQTTDGGFIVGAHSGSFGAGSHDVYLIKCDVNGEIVWTKVYGGSSADGAYSIEQTKDGGYIVAAHVNSFGAGLHDVYLIKTDAQGDTLWTKTYGGSGEDRLRAVQQTTDGGYILVAETLSFGAGSADVYLVKTDSSGSLMWTKTYGGSSSDYGYSVRQTKDGGYIIAGYTSSFGAGMADVYLIRTDNNGDISWAKTFGGISSDFGYSVRQTTDEGYIVAGYTESFGTAGDVYLLHTDSDGNLLWSQSYGGAGNDRGWSVQQTTDGGYVIAGYSESFGADGKDMYLIKTDEFGSSGCQESTAATTEGNTETIVNSMQTSIGSGGFVNTTTTITGEAATIDSLICSNFPTDIEQPDSADANAEEFTLFQNYPNPFNPSTRISYSLPNSGFVSLTVHDMLGREIETLVNEFQEAGIYAAHFDASKFASGIYFYKLQTGRSSSTVSPSNSGQGFVKTKKMLFLR